MRSARFTFGPAGKLFFSQFFALGARCDFYVGDHRQMVGNGPCRRVGVPAHQRVTRSAVDPVEVKQRAERWKRAMARAAGQRPGQDLAHRTGPHPIIEIAEHYRRLRRVADQFEQCANLALAFSKT